MQRHKRGTRATATTTTTADTTTTTAATITTTTTIKQFCFDHVFDMFRQLPKRNLQKRTVPYL